jgi:AcrR family transcriptional regulator
MDTSPMPMPGLRERKKRKTRETIVEVALDLFAEKGYEHTTIAEIADAAEISRRTVFAYFPTKEDILFHEKAEWHELLAQALRDRPKDATALDAARDFFVVRLSTHDPTLALRKRIVAGDAALQESLRARLASLEQLIIDALAEELDAGPDDLRPKMIAAAFTAACGALHDSDAQADGLSPEQALAALDNVLGFMPGGLEAIRDA